MHSQFPEIAAEPPELSAAALKARLDAGEHVTVLDTRRPADFDAWRIDAPGVTNVNVPFTAFLDADGEPVAELPDGVPDGPVVTNCAKGISSEFVARVLAREGREVEALADGMRGWARLYERREIESDADATVVQYHRPSSGCLAYLVASGGEAAVIDPLRAFADEYAADAREHGADLVYAVDTHVHADHVSGVREVADTAGATVVVPEGAEDRGFTADSYRTVADGDRLRVGDATPEAVHVPGHTSEMTGFRVGDVFLTGDTLFTGSVARPDLEEGDEGAPDAARRLYDTLQSIASLPDDTVVAPAHTDADASRRPDGTHTARLGDLRDSLDAFRMDRDAFVERVLDGMPPRPNNYETIIETNLGRHRAADDEAFELELGPNNCAAAPADD
jgi:glyoxylase-like metal-dependent hydrolase (beta-lactamase superfamily II)/rhodanese-related sulfurtransferase